MNKIKTTVFGLCSVVIMSAFISCGGSSEKKDNSIDSTKIQKKDTVVSTVKPGSLDDAKLLIAKFFEKGADYAKLTNSLKPTLEDAKSICVKETDAKKINDYITKAYEQGNSKKNYIQPKDGQTENEIIPATVKEIKEGKGNAASFPGGYKEISAKLKDDVTLYVFKFFKKGQKEGVTYNGLTYVNNHWVVFLKLWKAFK
jgi:hypothetical protein